MIVLLAVACSSAAVLIFEIALTRVFAVTQFYHFAFMTVSLALLGFGASGSALAAFPRLGRGGARRWARLAFGQSIGTLGAYALANALPFDSFSIAWDARQVVYLIAMYLALVVPFFFGGAVVGALLSSGRMPSHHVYAANLAGSGAGCLLALGGLAWLGGVGVIVFAAWIAMLAALLFEWVSEHKPILPVPAQPNRKERRERKETVMFSLRPLRSLRLNTRQLRVPYLFSAIAIGSIVLLAIGLFRPPDWLDLRLSPYKDLSAALRYPGARILSTRWNASSRVDHIESAGIRSLPGLSFAFRGSPPPQDGLTFDGDDLSPIPLVDPAQADVVPHLLMSLPFALRPDADALILEPRGGLDVFIARATGARSIVAVEPNELALEAARDVYDDPRVTVIRDEPRAFVERSAARFDVIDLALTAPYRPVTSGAYSLAEDYRLTVEAFERYLSRLKPEGLLVVMRWLQTPPSEELRLIGLAAEAVKRSGGDPVQSIVALRGYSTALALVKQGRFTDDELAAMRAFAQARRFDFIAAPGLRADEANRYNVLPVDDYYRLAALVLSAPDPSAVIAAYAFDIAPPTDDHPFFGHFFKWSQAGEVLARLGKTWQPFGGAGYFVLVVLLGFSTLAALVLIVAPLVRRRDLAGLVDLPGLRWTVAYFGLLGIAYLFVEIPLIQQYILLMGRPTIALAVVLFALLVASGLGSLFSRRLPWRAGAIGLTIAVAVYPSLIRALTHAILPAPIEARLIVGGLALAPLGFLMGTLFPKGIAYLEARAPERVAWAWGINGAASVISAITSALLALTFGFSIVVACGAVCYGICSLLVKGTKLTPPRL